MSVSLGAALSQQMFSDSFDYLVERLGADLVSAIPVCKLASSEYGEGEYPLPWHHARELEADVVKGILPSSGRPFLAMRYIEEKTNRIALEFFFQRYGDKDPMYKSNWAATQHLTSNKIYLSCKDMFPLIEKILRGSPLEETGGRYLPAYAAHYKKPVLAIAEYAESTDWGDRSDSYLKRESK